jgi:adenylylsulfate kinase
MIYDHTRPTALFVGRYQPFHPGHLKLIEEGIKRLGQVCIAVRDMPDGPENPFRYADVYRRIRERMNAAGHEGKFIIVPLPNITNIMYGRDVGYSLDRIFLDKETEAISATDIRAADGR